jgi:1,4-alpha-glucan branching enzyme
LVADQRTVQFKFRFPEEARRWEGDEYVRVIPTRRAQNFWAFDWTSRVMWVDPWSLPEIEVVTVHLLTRGRFAGGQLYAWQPDAVLPGQNANTLIRETSRDNRRGVSVFHVPLEPWMRRGFYFKFVESGGAFEADACNRVWCPADGESINVRSGQATIWAGSTTTKPVILSLLYPRQLEKAPELKLTERGRDPFEQAIAAASTVPSREAAPFARAEYALQLFPESLYSVGMQDPTLEGGVCRPLRVAVTDTGKDLEKLALLGDDRWLTQVPAQAPLGLVFHPRQWTRELGRLAFELRVGDAPAFDLVAAALASDGSWRADTRAPIGVALQATPIADQPLDERADGTVLRRRSFALEGTGAVDLHTADAQPGFWARSADAQCAQPHEATATSMSKWPLPMPAEPSVSRRTLLGAAFHPNIVQAGVFDAHELPHGATAAGEDVYFVVVAPHAVQLGLVLWKAAQGRVLYPMQPTTDKRYWWCKLPVIDVPHGQRYRFLQNDDVEVLDPATRWAADPAGELWANVGEDDSRAWSRYLDPSRISNVIAPGFSTVAWENLIIYELHAQRFTVRNSVPDGLDQVAAELRPGAYLERLGVTALEFLPLHEFSKGSWGYTPSLFFAVNATFGGPEALARVVQASHQAGKGIIMDVVFNHVQESPLQGLAKNVYVDGQTAWGDMINYDHPVCMEFFRQALVYLWYTFQVDGFRFDSAGAIVNGQWKKDGVINVPGSGGGWEFLGFLRTAVRKAADATQRRWPYFVGENDPNNWGMTNNANGGVLDGQWHFGFHYLLDGASREDGDASAGIAQQMAEPHNWLRPFSEAVRYAESHDSCGHRDGFKRRVARRAPFGRGFQTSKAVGTVALLAQGIPMLFQGQEGGEDEDFFFDYDPKVHRGDPRYFARLGRYEDLGDDRNRILAWYRDLMGLRNNPSNGFQGNDDVTLGRGYRTVAFSRAGGRFFVVATFGTTDTQQTLGWLQLPDVGSAYKEILNSSWPAYRVENELEFSNGSYGAVLDSRSVIHLPPVGAVVLERR